MASILSQPQWVNNTDLLWPSYFNILIEKFIHEVFKAVWLFIVCCLACGVACYNGCGNTLGGVSKMFHELSKIFSRNLCFAEIILLARISSWNFICAPKALGTRTRFHFEFLTINVISGIVYFCENILGELMTHLWNNYQESGMSSGLLCD